MEEREFAWSVSRAVSGCTLRSAEGLVREMIEAKARLKRELVAPIRKLADAAVRAPGPS
jgi:hypothetical protein